MRARFLLALTTAALLVAACGDGDDPADSSAGHPAPHWRILEGEGANALALPDARFAAPDAEDGGPRLVLNVLPTGDVRLKGSNWHLLADDAQTRASSREGLRAQLTELVARLREDGDAAASIPVLLHADREAPWRAVRELLAILREPDLGTRSVQWAVRAAASTDEASRIDGTLSPEAPPSGDPLLLRVASDRGETWTVVRVFGPEKVHSLGPQLKVFARPKFVDRANRAWDDLERKLPAIAEGHDAAHVVVDDERADVWFAYVVKTVDLLFGAGYEAVDLPQAGLRLSRPSGDG